MTTPQNQVPPPPEGYASWLDYCIARGWSGYCANRDEMLEFAELRKGRDAARAELAALRKELSDTKAEHAVTHGVVLMDIIEELAKIYLLIWGVYVLIDMSNTIFNSFQSKRPPTKPEDRLGEPF